MVICLKSLSDEVNAVVFIAICQSIQKKPDCLCLFKIYPHDGCPGSSHDNKHQDILFSVISPWGYIAKILLICQFQRSDPIPLSLILIFLWITKLSIARY
jgi:hypothetical protein